MKDNEVLLAKDFHTTFLNKNKGKRTGSYRMYSKCDVSELSDITKKYNGQVYEYVRENTHRFLYVDVDIEEHELVVTPQQAFFGVVRFLYYAVEKNSSVSVGSLMAFWDKITIWQDHRQKETCFKISFHINVDEIGFETYSDEEIFKRYIKYLITNPLNEIREMVTHMTKHNQRSNVAQNSDLRFTIDLSVLGRSKSQMRLPNQGKELGARGLKLIKKAHNVTEQGFKLWGNYNERLMSLIEVKNNSFLTSRILKLENINKDAVKKNGNHKKKYALQRKCKVVQR